MYSARIKVRVLSASPKSEYSDNDRKLVNILNWLDEGLQGPSDIDELKKRIDLAKIPPNLRKRPKTYLFRGMLISEEAFRSLKKGRAVPLNPWKLSYWTSDLKRAVDYASLPNKKGVVIKYPPAKMNILLDVEATVKHLGLKPIARGPAGAGLLQKEFIVEGTGIDKIRPEYVVEYIGI